jgi:hypothetical protein
MRADLLGNPLLNELAKVCRAGRHIYADIDLLLQLDRCNDGDGQLLSNASTVAVKSRLLAIGITSITYLISGRGPFDRGRRP